MLHHDEVRERVSCGVISADDLFGGLDPRDLNCLASIEKHFTILPDNIVFASGDQPHKIYIHRSGQAVLFQKSEQCLMVDACPDAPNLIYGLVEALSTEKFEMSMKTATDSEFDVISRDDFLKFLHDKPAVSIKLVEILSRLYQQSLQIIRSH